MINKTSEHLLYYWTGWAKTILLIGWILLIIGAVLPWYNLPKEGVEAFQTSLFWVNIVRIIPILLAVIGLILAIVRDNSRAHRNLFIMGLIAALLFPWFLCTFLPTISFLSLAYFNQIVQIVNEVNNHFPDVQAQWKYNIALNIVDVHPSTFGLQIVDSTVFQIPFLYTFLAHGLGYRNGFFTFVGNGWVLTIAGLTICLIGFYIAAQKKGLNTLIKDLNFWVPKTLLFLALIWVSIIIVNVTNYQIDTDFAKGDYKQVIANSKTLLFWYPAVRGDERFIERLNRADYYVNRKESNAQNFVKGLENYRNGNFYQAGIYFKEFLDLHPSEFLARSYLASSVLQQASFYITNNDILKLGGSTIRSSNNDIRKPGGSIDLLEKSLQIFPGNIETLYNLMLARVINGEFQSSADVAQKILDEIKFYQNKFYYQSLLGQAYVHKSWSNFKKDNLADAWRQYFQSTGEIKPN